MASSLFSALSGLRAHENWLSVIGNNLANANTPGFKSSRAVFSDLFNRTLRFASLPGGTLGGKNPVQIGSGVQLSDVGRNFGQGTLNNTGRTFDLALNGEGFFIVSDGTNQLYTRVGTFGLDGSGRMVDQRTGFLVMSPTGQKISIDTNAQLPPKATGHVELAGNLPAEVTGPLAQEVTSSTGFLEGTQAQVVGGAAEPFSIPADETWTMELIVHGGAPEQVQMTGPGPFTAQDFVDAINALGSGVTAAAAGGAVQITTERSGENASIKVQPGSAGRDLAGLLGFSTSLVTGSEFAATLGTSINSLPTNLIDYAAGETINISGIDGDGSPVSGSFVFGPNSPAEHGTTLGELLGFIDNLFPNAQADFDTTTGQISLTSDLTGVSNLTLTMVDGTANTRTNWAQHAFTITTAGAGPDTTSTAIEVYDEAGIAHTVTFELQREDNGSWRITPSTSNGSASPASITGLTFNNDGTIQSLPTATSFNITFAGQSVPQQIILGLGTPSTINGLTQFGEPASVFVDSQDGSGVGTLSSVSVNSNGDVQGFYSNGQIETLGEIGVATFVNVHGLCEVTDNLWSETANTGARTLGKATAGPAGEIVAGALESSNVEIAGEFVNLIEAQRGFQANARMISTTDEVLAELVNLL